MAKKENGEFERDFGYLMPFIDRVQAAGEALPPGSREELASLVAGERDRWERIRGLLAARGTAPAPAQSRPSSPPPPAGSGFTVGSLRIPGR
jgi:hypothetical protein